MSESEFEDILNEVKRKADANVPFSPPVVNGKSKSSVSDTEIDFDIFSAVHCDNGERRREKSTEPKKKGKGKLVLTAVLLVIIIVAGVATYFALSGNSNDGEETVTDSVVEVVDAVNPLTGESGYNTDAVGKSPVAVVVENEYSTEAVRPQWGLSDADIVLEAESEYSTRLLLIWADYTDVPDMVGPLRSARPSFIYFSQLFDCIFIHAGLSKSKGDYVGADTVFQNEDVRHINLLEYADDGTYFGRNNERNTSSEHTAYLNGANLPQLLEENDIETSLDSYSFTELEFYETATVLSDNPAESCSFEWSSGHCPKVAYFTYDSDSHTYLTTDYDSDYGVSNAAFTNLIFLFDETEYVVKEDYKNGQSETYCNYELSGGNGTILSEGTAVEITWGVSDGRLWMKTADGNDVVLNVGKTYIGYGSSNHGGSIQLNTTAENAVTY